MGGKASPSVGRGASATGETTHSIGPALAKAGTLGALLGLGALVARGYLRYRRSCHQRRTAGSSNSKEGGASQQRQPHVRTSIDLECRGAGPVPDVFESPFAPISQEPLRTSQELPRMASAELLGGFLEESWKVRLHPVAIMVREGEEGCKEGARSCNSFRVGGALLRVCIGAWQQGSSSPPVKLLPHCWHGWGLSRGAVP